MFISIVRVLAIDLGIGNMILSRLASQSAVKGVPLDAIGNRFFQGSWEEAFDYVANSAQFEVGMMEAPRYTVVKFSFQAMVQLGLLEGRAA